MIFQHPSTRTRNAFQAGMEQLGGHATFLGAHDLQLTRGETLPDTAQILSRYVDGIAARFGAHDDLITFMGGASVPVYNALYRAVSPHRGAERPVGPARPLRRAEGPQAGLRRRRQQRLPLPAAQRRGGRHARRRRLAASGSSPSRPSSNGPGSWRPSLGAASRRRRSRPRP